MSEFIHKSHIVTVLLYHLVFPAKYRRVVFDKGVDRALTEVCLEIEKRYEVKFLEIGTDQGESMSVYFLNSLLKVRTCNSYATSKTNDSQTKRV